MTGLTHPPAPSPLRGGGDSPRGRGFTDTPQPLAENSPSPYGEGAGGWAIAAIALLAGVGFAVAAVARYRSYHSTAYDLAFFDQIIWNTAQGRWFETTFLPYSFLGQHVQPVLLLYAALYRLHATPEILLVTQAFVIAAAAVPLYDVVRSLLGEAPSPAPPPRSGRGVPLLGVLINREWLLPSKRWPQTCSRGTPLPPQRGRGGGGGRWAVFIPVLVAVLYLLSPYLDQAVHFDFHPETMSPFFVFLAYALLLRGRRWAAVAAALPVLLLKEDTAVLLIGVAWLFWLRRERRAAGVLAGVAAAWGAVATLVVMPHFRIGPSDLEARYGYLGSGSGAILTGLVTHPERVLAHLLTWGTLLTVLGLLGSTGFLPLAAPAELLAVVPLLAFHLLSTHFPQMMLRLHYSAEVLPLIWLAAAVGLAHLTPGPFPRGRGGDFTPTLRMMFKRNSHYERSDNRHDAQHESPPLPRGKGRGVRFPALLALTLCALIAFLVGSPFPPAREFHIAQYTTSATHRAAVEEAIAQIPPDASVSATTGIATHLAHRAAINDFPEGVGADYLVWDDADTIAAVYRPQFAAAIATGGYAPIWSRDGVTLCRKNT